MLPNVSIPVSVILIPAALFLLFYLLRALANIYVLVRYGEAGGLLTAIILIFCLGSGFILVDTGLALAQYDLSQPFDASLALPSLSLPKSATTFPSLNNS